MEMESVQTQRRHFAVPQSPSVQHTINNKKVIHRQKKTKKERKKRPVTMRWNHTENAKVQRKYWTSKYLWEHDWRTLQEADTKCTTRDWCLCTHGYSALGRTHPKPLGQYSLHTTVYNQLTFNAIQWQWPEFIRPDLPTTKKWKKQF